MLKGLATAAVGCLLALSLAPSAIAEPDIGPPPVNPSEPLPVNFSEPPPPEGAVASSPPGVQTTPEGWTLTVGAHDESQVAVNPLTTALSSREYLVKATFTGSVTGQGTTTLAGGTIEVGYQIGCGIAMSNVKLQGTAGIVPQVVGGINFPIGGFFEVALRPGDVNVVQILKKEFNGTSTRVTVNDTHIKIDGCAGQSFLRSYAILTSVNDVTDDVVAYYGVTKAV